MDRNCKGMVLTLRVIGERKNVSKNGKKSNIMVFDVTRKAMRKFPKKFWNVFAVMVEFLLDAKLSLNLKHFEERMNLAMKVMRLVQNLRDCLFIWVVYFLAMDVLVRECLLDVIYLLLLYMQYLREYYCLHWCMVVSFGFE